MTVNVATTDELMEGPEFWTCAPEEVHRGMPPLDMSNQPVSFFEFWPAGLFYAPVALHWLLLAVRHRGLTLPTATNPAFPLGGLVGESKAAVMENLSGKALERFADFASYTRGTKSGAEERDAALACVRGAGLEMPFVAKPDMGCRGVGVRLIRDAEQLDAWLDMFPANQIAIFQKYIPYEAEAGIFYVRPPGHSRGKIISLTLKYFPHVVGDGHSSVEALILADPRAGILSHLYLPRHRGHLDHVLPDGQPMRLAFTGSHSRGAIFRNGNEYITDAMARAFDEVADGVKGFCFGRFDARFPSIAELQDGGEFHLMEINGAGGEAAHIWDSRTTLGEAYATLRQQFRLAFEIGAANRRMGSKPSTILEVYRAWQNERRTTLLYPPTE